RMPALNELAFHRPERRLTLLRENLRHRFPLQALDLVIAIHKLETYLSRDEPADGAFARAHETDEIEVCIHAWSRSEHRSRIGARPLRTPSDQTAVFQQKRLPLRGGVRQGNTDRLTWPAGSRERSSRQ